VWRAVADFKAAVRWFHMSAETGNPYRIDTSRLYIGGVSAGAVSAIHYAYLDDINEMPSFIDTTKQGLGGGIEGASGNPGYSSDIDGVIGISGMIADTAWIRANDEPIVMLHGTNDDVVPYATDLITVVSVYPIFVVDGSETIEARMNDVGVENCLFTHHGAGHTPHVGSQAYTDTTLNIIKNFMYGLVCGGSGSCGFLVNTEEALSNAVLEVFPNPAAGEFRVRVGEDWALGWSWRLMDMTGRLVASEQSSGVTESRVNRDLPAGIYLLEAAFGDVRKTVRVVVE
ncbi:MAG: T9SS type A sorting domain-containing protein, partial [Bacteroidota bacterium]